MTRPMLLIEKIQPICLGSKPNCGKLGRGDAHGLNVEAFDHRDQEAQHHRDGHVGRLNQRGPLLKHCHPPADSFRAIVCPRPAAAA